MPAKTKRRGGKQSLVFFTYTAICILLGLSTLNINYYLKNKGNSSPQVLGEKTEQLNQDKEFWLEFVSHNPNYLDGWIVLAEVNLRLGNLEEAKADLEKARVINPNSEKISEIGRNFK